MLWNENALRSFRQAALKAIVLFLGIFMASTLWGCTLAGKTKEGSSAEEGSLSVAVGSTVQTSASEEQSALADGSSATESSSSVNIDTSKATDPAIATNPSGTPIAEAMPYVGMPVALIDATWMGVHDGTDPFVSGGSRKGAAPYYWCAQNGTGDRIYTVYVRQGKVIGIAKSMMWTNYWREEGSYTLLEFPNRTASGERVEQKKIAATLPDPLDYDDPYEYANDAEDYFKEQGAADPWGEAIDWWNTNVGW